MQDRMEQNRAYLEKWLEQTLATYPSETLAFLRREKDRFHNPVGHTLREGLGTLLDELLGEMNLARLAPALESIVRLRAVQDFTPGQAVGFVYLLREILGEERAGGVLAASPVSGSGQKAGTIPSSLERVRKRIDELALLAFDHYMKCREEIWEIKAREAQRKVYVWGRMSERT